MDTFGAFLALAVGLMLATSAFMMEVFIRRIKGITGDTTVKCFNLRHCIKSINVKEETKMEKVLCCSSVSIIL